MQRQERKQFFFEKKDQKTFIFLRDKGGKFLRGLPRLIRALGLTAALTGCAASPPKLASAAGSSSAIRPGSCSLCADIADRVFFEFDSARLTPGAQIILTKQATWLLKYPANNIMIAGNADDRGTEEYDLALGYRRAKAAGDFLAANGVKPSRISLISYGKDRPQAIGGTEQAWAQNRSAITSVIQP